MQVVRLGRLPAGHRAAVYVVLSLAAAQALGVLMYGSAAFAKAR